MDASSGRGRLIEELERYARRRPAERAVAERIAAFVRAHDACFERSLAQGHLTGSAWVIDRAGSAALLTHHRKLGRWLQLGGHADGCSDLRAVALREAHEESGLAELVPASPEIYDLDVHAIPARGAEPEHLHYDVRFAFFADPGQTPVVSAESHAVAWVPLDALERYAVDESVRRLAAKTAEVLTPPSS